MSSLDTVDRELLAYLAGIVDGEGSITVSSKERGRNYACRLAVGMTSLEIVLLLQSAFGGSIRTEERENRMTMYRWYLTKNADTLATLTALRPFLRVKQRQADLVVDFIIHNPVPNGGVLSSDERSRRESIYTKVRKLNAVGAAAVNNN